MFVLIGLSFLIWPWLIQRLVFAKYSSSRLPYSENAWILFLCSMLFIGSFYLPDIHLVKQTETFQQHFVGGGILSAFLLKYYLAENRLHLSRRTQLLVLFPLVSTLGTMNELFEFSLVQTGRFYIDNTDVWWDIFANTFGAYFGYIFILVIYKKRFHKNH